MKSKIKKILCYILVSILVISYMPSNNVSCVDAASGITTSMIDVICQKYGYSVGRYWTYKGDENKNKYTASDTKAGVNGYKGYTFGGGSQCWAFARFLMSQVAGEKVGTGSWKRISAANATSIKVGDVVCIGDKVHTAVAYKDLGNGKFQFIEIWTSGTYGHVIKKGGYNGTANNTLASVKNMGLQYIYRYNGTPTGTVIVNEKATNITSNGAKIECDVNPAKTLKAVQVTVWSDVQGIDKHQWITKASSVSGNHYIFDMKVSNFNYQRGLYKANIHVFYTDGTKDITTSPIQFTIPNPAVISNAKATNISNRGASIECDINPAKTLNVVQVTVWSDVQGIDKHQWITKASSISGNHYIFDMKVSNFNNQRGLYKANIHVFYTDGTKDITSSPLQFTIPENTAPLAVLDVIRSEDFKSIHIAGWAFDPDEPSKSIEIHVYVGKPAGTAGIPATPVTADMYRKDVNDAYRITGSHGYDLTINTTVSGNQTVYLYALDSQGGNNPCFKEVKVDIKNTHQMEWYTLREPKCETNGDKIKKCKVCGETDASTFTVIEPLGHDWDSGIITTKATCTEAGEKTYTCKRCGKTKSESIDAIGHEWEKYGKSYPCEETHHYICKNCGVLSYEKGPFVGAKEHTIVIDKAIEPTYTKTGLTEGSHCSVCGKVIVKQEVIPVLVKKTSTTETPATKTSTTKTTTTKTTTTKTQTTKPTNQQTVSEKPKVIVGVGTISSDGTILTDADGIKYYVSEKLTNDKLSKGISLADQKSAGKYKITKIIKTNGKVTGGTVTYMKPYNKNCITANVKVSIIISGAKFKVTAIAKKAFMGCKSLTKVTIKKNVKYIGNSAFENCTSLKTVICKSVRLTKIGERVFYGDKNLKSISFKSTKIKKIGKNAFRRINKRAKISVPPKRLKKYKKMIKNAGAPKKVKIKK